MLKKLIKRMCNFVPTKGEKVDYTLIPRINRTVVSQQFINENPTWDSHLFNNIKIIK
jgi:hypothetical protein